MPTTPQRCCVKHRRYRQKPGAQMAHRLPRQSSGNAGSTQTISLKMHRCLPLMRTQKVGSAASVNAGGGAGRRRRVGAVDGRGRLVLHFLQNGHGFLAGGPYLWVWVQAAGQQLLHFDRALLRDPVPDTHFTHNERS